MSKTHLVIPDSHAHPDHNNNRYEWLGGLINDVCPDVVINLGDGADMPSLSSYDKGTKGFEGRRYQKDIAASIDSHERLFGAVNVDVPMSVYCIGNHEHRITKACNSQPELEGKMSIDDLELHNYYDKVVDYNGGTPGIIKIDGINYAHFFTSGVMGRAIGGMHPAASLIAKGFESSTSGHLHLLDFSERTTFSGRKLMGLMGGCYIEHFHDWAGHANNLWWSGVIVKRNVKGGSYDPEFITLKELKRRYG